MIFIFLFLFVFFFFMFKLIKKYDNPYKLYMVFGKKGSGKTTLLTKLAMDAVKKGHTVYSTVDVPGCITFDPEKTGLYTFPPESYVFYDEVGILWDNRNFKNFKPEVRDYFKFQRQYRNTVYLFSQTFDIDKKLRDLTDGMYLCKCYFGFISLAHRINRSIVLTEATADSESRIADNLSFESFISFLTGGKPFLFTYIPKYAPYFNSFNPPALQFMPGELKVLSKIPKSSGSVLSVKLCSFTNYIILCVKNSIFCVDNDYVIVYNIQYQPYNDI